MTPTSGEADGIRLIRSISLIARALISSGMPAALDLLAKLVDLGLLRIVLAELALDRLELLAKDVLALGLVHLGLDFGLDPALQLEDLDLAGEERLDELQALDDVDRLEQLLALLGGHVGAVGDHVGQQPGLGDVAGGHGGLRRNGRAVGDVLLDPALDGPHQGLDLDPRRRRVGELLDRRPRCTGWSAEAIDAQPALALDDRPDGAVLELDDLGDLGQRPDRVELGGVLDVLLLGLALGHQRDRAAASTAALSALTLFSRPTWSGTIISGKITVSRRATAAASRGVVPEPFGLLGLAGRSDITRVSCGVRRSLPRCVERYSVRPLVVRRAGLGFIEEGFQDPGPESLLELEQDPDPGEVDAAFLGQVPDPQDPPDVVLAVEANVGWGPGGAEQALVLVDPERSRMDAGRGRPRR